MARLELLMARLVALAVREEVLFGLRKTPDVDDGRDVLLLTTLMVFLLLEFDDLFINWFDYSTSLCFYEIINSVYNIIIHGFTIGASVDGNQ